MTQKYLRTPGTTEDEILKKVSADTVRIVSGTDDISGTGNFETAGPRPQADVRAYGAKGDDSTNDRQAFTKALASLATVGGGILLVPPGIYRIGDTLVIDQPVTILGTHREACIILLEGEQRLKAASSNVTFKNLTFKPKTGNGRQVFANHTYSETPIPYGNWRFDSCAFHNVKVMLSKANRVVNTGTGTSTVDTGTQIANDVTVVDCIFRNVAVSGNALQLSGVTDFVIDRCLFELNALNASSGAGLRLDGATSRGVVTNCTVRNNDCHGVDLYDAQQITVTFCLIENNGNGTNANPKKPGLETKWSNVACSNPTDRNIISFNRVRDNGKEGLRIDAPRHICIGNQVEGNGDDGIYLNVNDTIPPQAPAVSLEQNQSVIANNICRNNVGGSEINVDRAQAVLVTGNQCHGNTVAGITSKAPVGTPPKPGNVFSGNMCFDNNNGDPDSGIVVAGMKHIVSANLTQDTDGSEIAPGANLIQRDGYGQTSGAPNASDWPVGVIVCNISANPDTYHLRVPSPTDWVEIDMV